MGGAKTKIAAASRAAKKAMNAVPPFRSRKPPAFSMAMALRIRQGLNVNAKHLQEGPGSLRVLRYLEPKAPEGTREQAGSEDTSQAQSSASKAIQGTNGASATMPRRSKRMFMSIKEINEKIAASNAVEPDVTRQTTVADRVPSVLSESSAAPQTVDRAGLPTLDQYMQEDVLFVSIDTEMIQDPDRSRYGITEVGMSLLDTRDLRQFDDLGVRGEKATDIFDSHQFGLYKNQEVLDGEDGDVVRARIRSRASKYVFGRAAIKWISQSRIEREMSRLIYQKLGDELSRKVVFLFFDKTYDVQFLNEANVFLTEEFPIHEIIDMQTMGTAAVIAKVTNQPRASAEIMYDYLGVPTSAYENTYSPSHPANKQHNAGNDALFQMQAWVAGLCLEDEHWESLHRGEKLRPEMKAIWERGGAKRRTYMGSATG